MVALRRPTAWARWVKQKLRETRAERNSLEIGGVYIFGYEPRKRDAPNYDVPDMLPLLILIRKYGSGLLGVNVTGIPERSVRIRILERYHAALEESNLKARMRELNNISRMVQHQDPAKDAYKLYKFRDIKTKIVKVTAEEIQELAKRVL